MANPKISLDAEKLGPIRTNTDLYLLQNPNYFGTVKDAAIAAKFYPVFDLSNSQHYYEELGCIAYNPATKKLGAVVIVKQASGYAGSLCNNSGSREYVRFFVDYDHSGTWVDEGLAQFGVYDHPFSDDLSYYAEIDLSPDKTSCCFNNAILPRVRAILSWNIVPTAGDPAFPFVWGDVKETDIQIAPSNSRWCYLLSALENVSGLELKKELKNLEKLIPEINDPLTQVVPQAKSHLSVPELLKTYTVSEHHGRIIYDAIKFAHTNTAINTFQLEKEYPGFDVAKIIGALIDLSYDTTYEEVHCVGLNRDINTLHASVQVKQKFGYLGNLCFAGSKEYVAFYMDFGSGWKYMGTSSVQVHDITTLPANGLWYDVSLNVNLDAYRKEWCTVGEAKVRAILSWNTPPTPNDPDFHARWGDREECNVEICPLPRGVHHGQVLPVIEKVGGMVVGDINSDGLATTTPYSASLGGAYESPFYGEIQIVGRIFNAAPGAQYRFRIITPVSAIHPVLDNQLIQTDTLGVISLPITLVPNPEGWLSYPATNPNVAIVGDLIGRYYPAREGMYTIQIEMRDTGNIITAGNSANFFVDLNAPDVMIHITSGGGDCADFTTGDTVTGTYSMSDAHAKSFNIHVTPDKGAKVAVDGHVPVNTSDGLSYPGAELPDTGKSGSFSIDTAGVPKCGYNVWIQASDRTIVNSSQIGLTNSDVLGFCLRDK